VRRLGDLARKLPPPVYDRVQAARGALARAVAGTELHRMRQEMDQLRAEVDELLARHGQDLVARNDAVLSNYDRRVADVANRLMDLEARVNATPPPAAADANRILAAHEEHA
jgi:ElaB/YqjD/DUF883 family membrane-anchored ribosome-binding protein